MKAHLENFFFFQGLSWTPQRFIDQFEKRQKKQTNQKNMQKTKSRKQRRLCAEEIPMKAAVASVFPTKGGAIFTTEDPQKPQFESSV